MNFKTIAEILMNKGFPSDSFNLDAQNNRFAKLDVELMDALIGSTGYLTPANKKYKNNDDYRVDFEELLPQYVMKKCKVMISSRFRDMERDSSKDGLFMNSIKHLDAYRGIRNTSNIFYGLLEGNEEYKSSLKFPFDQPLQFEGFYNRYTAIALSEISDSEKFFGLDPTILTWVDLVQIAYDEDGGTINTEIGYSEKVGSWISKFTNEKNYHNAFYFLDSIGYQVRVINDETWGRLWSVNDGSKDWRFQSEYTFIEYAIGQLNNYKK